MPFAENFMVQGTFTAGTLNSASTIPTSVNVNCGFIPTRVELIDMTTIGSMTGGPPLLNPGANYLLFRASWQTAFATAATPFTLVEALTPSAATVSVQPITASGITPYDGHAASPGQLLLGPKIAGTNTAKATGIFTVASTATLFPGAVILMTSNSVNKQLGGMFFTVATVASGTTFTIANASWLNTGNFTNGAETFNIQLVTVPGLYYPYRAQIVNISAANPAVVTTSVNTQLTVGQQVRLYVPRVFGMTQANFVTAIISAVSGNQVTLGGFIGLNASAFTAFAWPAASGVPYTPAVMVPIGSGPSPTSNPLGYNYDTLDDATENLAFQGFTVGPGILNTASTTVPGVVAGDVIAWTAWRSDV